MMSRRNISAFSISTKNFDRNRGRALHLRPEGQSFLARSGKSLNRETSVQRYQQSNLQLCQAFCEVSTLRSIGFQKQDQQLK
jgi:hypothetical protein